MKRLVDIAIETYATEHSTGPTPLHLALRDETHASTTLPQMQVGAVEGRFLTLLARLVRPRLAVEVGTFTGYSGLHIAEGLAPEGRLLTCELDPGHAAMARRYFDESPFGHRITIRLGPAADTLAAIEEPIDFAFIDADKTGYLAYWELLVPRMRAGGLIVVDNVLWSGRVLAPESADDHAIVAFNTHVHGDARVELVMLTVRDGMTLAVKR